MVCLAENLYTGIFETAPLLTANNKCSNDLVATGRFLVLERRQLLEDIVNKNLDIDLTID